LRELDARLRARLDQNKAEFAIKVQKQKAMFDDESARLRQVRAQEHLLMNKQERERIMAQFESERANLRDRLDVERSLHATALQQRLRDRAVRLGNKSKKRMKALPVDLDDTSLKFSSMVRESLHQSPSIGNERRWLSRAAK